MATYKGFFKPKNPQKYNGDPTNIVYRSGWELKLMLRLDEDPQVVKWSSEELAIPYRSPIDNRIHRYFPDFLVTKINKEGIRETLMVEVKPFKQTQPPEMKTAKTKRYINEVVTWGVNQAKWKAAEEFCKDRNYRFILMTENELGISF
jgi:TnsA endonuclease N terminal